MLYRFDNVEKSYGPHDVLRGVTWQHNPGEHVGLVGRNGAGKTTLFRLLLKQEEPDHGQILRSSGLTLGHDGQHLDAEPGMTLFDYVETAFHEVLASFKGSYLVISHDRTFLNHTVGKIVELAHGKLIEYHGNYEKFLEQRGERMEKLAADYERQQEFIEKTQDFIRRNLAGQKTKQAKSRRKMLGRLDELERPEHDETLATFKLDAGPRSGAIALTADRLSAGYDHTIVNNLSMTIRRGERYAIMGPNGSGKSTLLKTFAGRPPPNGG